jgi:hypothetical protein
MLCKRCVLPEYKPHIYLNEEGLCNICVDFDKRKNSGQRTKLLESELTKVLAKYRGKGKYDCLVMCSGGKDSTSSLYYIKKKYKLNPLVFTFDNGFESKEAIENVRNAVKALGADWLYFKSEIMKDIYAEVLKTKYKFSLCPLCSLWYMMLTYQIATQYNTPLIIAGWTRGQLRKPVISIGYGRGGLQSVNTPANLQEEVEIKVLCESIPSFIDIMKSKYPKYKDFPKTMKEAMGKYRISKKGMVLSPHWFLADEPAEYTELITKELNWKPIPLSYPKGSTNCYLNCLGSYLSIQGYGFTHFHVEMSKLIRLGELSRQEALEKLKIDIDTDPFSSTIDSVLNKLGCTRQDLNYSKEQ